MTCHNDAVIGYIRSVVANKDGSTCKLHLFPEKLPQLICREFLLNRGSTVIQKCVNQAFTY